MATVLMARCIICRTLRNHEELIEVRGKALTRTVICNDTEVCEAVRIAQDIVDDAFIAERFRA
jgi:hypothetical protein